MATVTRSKATGKSASRKKPARTYDSALKYLFAQTDYEQMLRVRYNRDTFSLDRMRLLLQKLGNPHNKIRTVHIAGTKGKGSTATMLAEMLRACGYKVGLYTSPHICDVRERICINGDIITQAALARLICKVEPIIEKMADDKPTFFEIFTAMAFQHFANEKVGHRRRRGRPGRQAGQHQRAQAYGLRADEHLAGSHVPAWQHHSADSRREGRHFQGQRAGDLRAATSRCQEGAQEGGQGKQGPADVHRRGHRVQLSRRVLAPRRLPCAHLPDDVCAANSSTCPSRCSASTRRSTADWPWRCWTSSRPRGWPSMMPPPSRVFRRFACPAEWR